jgi:phosphatidylserine/phosphatidylglycerophosphate/cardiolipin synthase-like enzyme
MILHAIGQATNYIYFEDQFMVSPDASRALQQALTKQPQLQLIILIPDFPIVVSSVLTAKHREQFLAPLKAIAPDRVHVFVREPPGGQHTYIHSKTWIFDDKFAIIGSANCNNRSWTYDSEVVSGVCDPGDGVNQRMPHRLRVELWAEHLNATADQLDDWSAAVALWSHPPLGNHIRPYISWMPWVFGCESFWNNVVDPDAGPVP